MVKFTEIYFIPIILPLIACLIHLVCAPKKRVDLGARFSSYLMGSGLIITLFCLKFRPVQPPLFGFLATQLSWLLAALILFMSWIVQRFSIRYMHGDLYFSRFFTLLNGLTAALLCFVFSNHIFIFLLSLGISYIFLVRLIVHKSAWKASKESGVVALNYLGCSFALIAGALCFLAYQTGSHSLSLIFENTKHLSKWSLLLASIPLFIGALILSAAFPFHKWLLSSLNAPTPISAFMHAGLVNGGGILLIRFFPIYRELPALMEILILCGLVSTIVGTFWKLIQSDIKRLLACSTIAQMGFVFMQIGLGLFPAAIAHLCWHGMFKSYLFLRSGSSAKERRPFVKKQPLSIVLPLALLCGFLGAGGFLLLRHHLAPMVALLFMATMIGVAAAQLAIGIIEQRAPISSFFKSATLSILLGIFYAKSVGMIEKLLLPDISIVSSSRPFLFSIALFLFLAPWIAMQFGLVERLKRKKIWDKLYISMLNASQPSPGTITTKRTDYKY